MQIIENYKGDRRLYRSRDKKIGGVCQGLADYFNIDVVLIRIIALFMLFCGTAGFWVYLILWIAVPLEPKGFLTGRTDENERS